MDKNIFFGVIIAIMFSGWKISDALIDIKHELKQLNKLQHDASNQVENLELLQEKK